MTSNKWLSTPLKLLGEFKNGVNFGKEKKRQGELRLINVKDIFTDIPVIDFETLDNVDLANEKGIENYFVKSGDLFFVRSSVKRDGVGLVSTASQDNLQAIHCGFVIRFRPKSQNINSRFLAYLLRSPLYRQKIIGMSGGSAIININQETLGNLTVDLPPLPIQHRLTDILSTYDDLIENNTHRIRILEQMAQAIYQEWFGKVDKESLPDGWEIKPLVEIINFKNGKAINAEDEGDFPVYGSNGIIGRTSEARYKNAIIIGRVGAYCGSINYCSTQFSASDNTIIASPLPNSGFAENFAYRLLMNMNLRRFAGGAAQPLMTQSVLSKLETLVPPSSLCLEYEKVAANLFSLKTILEKENANLRQTRDLLLPRLVSGEIELK